MSPFSASSTFLDGNDLHSFIRSAIQAGVMGKFRLMALRTHGKARGCDPHLLGSPLVSTCSGYFMFWIWHSLPRSSISLVLIRGVYVDLFNRSCRIANGFVFGASL